MRILVDDVIFVVVDVQEKFQNHIHDLDTLIKNSNLLNRASEILDIPVLITEQNPKGLGATISEIYIPSHSDRVEKTKFSIFDEDIDHYIFEKKKKTVVLYGIEAHICILQSVLDAKPLGFNVVVVEDAVSSISPHNKKIAVERMRTEGAVIVTTEMLIFEMVKNAIHPDFRTISNLIKNGI